MWRERQPKSPNNCDNPPSKLTGSAMSTILMLSERDPATGGAFRQRIVARNVSTLNAANTNHDDYCRDFLEGMASNRLIEAAVQDGANARLFGVTTLT
jgi:hypothetical protein